MPAPDRQQIKPVVVALLNQEGLKGENAANLADAIADTMAQALQQFVTNVKVAPGIACSPAATTAPGKLM